VNAPFINGGIDEIYGSGNVGRDVEAIYPRSGGNFYPHGKKLTVCGISLNNNHVEEEREDTHRL
jgi:hypothetical protein